VYDDDGAVVNPADGSVVGTFAASGLMVPDGALGTAFFLGQTQNNFGGSTYTLESFDINRFTPIATLSIPDLIGNPGNLIRWGSDGLAFVTYSLPGSSSGSAVYIVESSFVSGETRPDSVPAENVHRTWKRRDVLHDAPSTVKRAHIVNSLKDPARPN
jgi:hypothetical protein